MKSPIVIIDKRNHGVGFELEAGFDIKKAYPMGLVEGGEYQYPKDRLVNHL